jgi:hypothetical protein
MATNKEILFSAKDNGVESTVNRLRRSAKELTSDLMREASSGAKSQSEILKNYEAQIRLIEKRNKLEAETQKMTAREKYDRVMSNPSSSEAARSKAQESYDKSMSSIGSSSKSDELLISMVREIVDTMKVEARKDSEGELRDPYDGRIISPGAASSTTVTDENGRPISRNEGGSSTARSGGRGVDAAGMIMSIKALQSSSSGGEAMMGLGGSLMSMGGNGGKAGMILAAVGGAISIANEMNDAYARLHRTMSPFASMSGRHVTGMTEDRIGSGAYKQGFSREEYMAMLPSLAQARTSSEYAEAAVNRSMRVQRGTGLDQSLITTLEGIGATGMSSKTDSASLINKLISTEIRTGAFQDSKGNLDLARLSESMQQFVSLQQSVMMRSGSTTDMSGAMQMSARLGSLGGAYKNDQYKWSTIQSMDKGISSTGSPESMAIKMGILRQSNPNMTYSQMMEEISKGIDSDVLTKGIEDYVNNTGGDDNARSILLNSMMGGNMNWGDTNKMTSRKNRGKMSKNISTEELEWTKMAMDDNARGAVSPQMKEEIKRKQDWEDTKMNSAKAVKDIVYSIDNLNITMLNLGAQVAKYFQ